MTIRTNCLKYLTLSHPQINFYFVSKYYYCIYSLIFSIIYCLLFIHENLPIIYIYILGFVSIVSGLIVIFALISEVVTKHHLSEIFSNWFSLLSIFVHNTQLQLPPQFMFTAFQDPCIFFFLSFRSLHFVILWNSKTYYLLFHSLQVFHTSISWFFTGVWVTATLLKSSWFFWVFLPILMLWSVGLDSSWVVVSTR